MTRSNTRQLVIALMFAIFMTGFFWISANADPASAVTVTVQAEDQYGNFILEPTTVDVSAGFASTFTNSTFSNASPATNSNATALDALFAAHVAKYGNSFTSNNYGTYIGGDSSYITKMFGIAAGSGYGFPAIMFAVNGMQPRDEDDPDHQFEGWGAHGPATGYWTYAMNQSILEDDDVVNFFFVNSYNDLYAYVNDGTDDYLDLRPLSDVFDASTTLYVKGYDYFTYGYLEQEGWNIVNISGAKVYLASDNTLLATTGVDGSFTLNSEDLEDGYNDIIIKPAPNSLVYFIPIQITVDNQQSN